MPMHKVTVLGAGLAGCEAAWQLAQRGIAVELWECKGLTRSPAHHSDDFCELVCSNSLRGAALSTAPGLLKEEMRRLGSLIIDCADQTAVPAGGALAVDRTAFSGLVTARIQNHPNITVRQAIAEQVLEAPVIVATGPLTDGALAADIDRLFGAGRLHFFDAAAPIVSADSIDMERAYIASRYDKGTPDYINCPMDREEYLAFLQALRDAPQATVHGFEDQKVFEGCMPVEVMARRGEDTLRFGPMKPVGLRDPRTGQTPYAVVQLRAENAQKTMYNLVGFQTHLQFGAQKQVFGMIPALRDATFLRYGVMHRNTFVQAPGKLDAHYGLITHPGVYFAGQMTGVEGYIESAASGLCAAVHLSRSLYGRAPIMLNDRTALGALAQHVSGYSGGNFQPMNINFGLIAPLGERIKQKRERYEALAARALEDIAQIKQTWMEDVQ